MNRRGFLGSILAACAAPAIVRADSLMRIVPMETTILPALDEYVITEIEEAAGNRFLTIDMITREALRIAHEKMTLIGMVSNNLNFLKVGDFISMPREKRGDTIRIRAPNRYAERA